MISNSRRKEILDTWDRTSFEWPKTQDGTLMHIMRIPRAVDWHSPLPVNRMRFMVQPAINDTYFEYRRTRFVRDDGTEFDAIVCDGVIVAPVDMRLHTIREGKLCYE